MNTLHVNGTAVEAAPGKPLLWVLREELHLTGTKYCCGAGDCGVCTVLVGGEALPSCQVSVEDVGGRPVLTIEGLAAFEPPHPVLRAWEAEAVAQCGYCQPGQILTAVALFATHPRPSDEQIAAAMDRVLCRCGTYARIRRAIGRLAAGEFGA